MGDVDVFCSRCFPGAFPWCVLSLVFLAVVDLSFRSLVCVVLVLCSLLFVVPSRVRWSRLLDGFSVFLRWVGVRLVPGAVWAAVRSLRCGCKDGSGGGVGGFGRYPAFLGWGSLEVNTACHVSTCHGCKAMGLARSARRIPLVSFNRGGE